MAGRISSTIRMIAARETGAAGPVVLSVPHAGREAPAALATLLRVPIEHLLPLEDRHADLLVGAVVGRGVPAIVARTPRIWIDLNRREDELDPAMVAGSWPRGPLATSAKLLGGLGLIPRRLAGLGELWRGPLSQDDVTARIERVHRPYHAAIAAALAEASTHHGRATLIDLHSMPPGSGADVVVGDLYGRAARPDLVVRAIACLRGHGLGVAINRPYAGGSILERHGRPARGVDAIQIEIDRRLYLAADLATPDPIGVARMAAVIDDLARTLGADESLPIAAE